MKRLRSWFAAQPIKNKLLLGSTVVIAMALTPIVIVMSAYEYHAMQQATLQEFRVQAEIVSDNAAAAMAFMDGDTAAEALATLRAAPDMQRSALLLPGGKVLATYPDGTLPSLAHACMQTPQSTQETLSWDGFQLCKPVHLKSELVGMLVLEAGLGTFYQRITFHALIILLATLTSLLGALWIASKLREAITLPLLQLLQFVDHVADRRDLGMRPATAERSDEIGDLSRAFHGMMVNLQERDRRLQELAYYDAVTSLLNRHSFQERVDQAVADAQRRHTRCCLMFIDLDDFKIVNDKLGHHVGDALLHEIGLRLSHIAGDRHLACRIGGDEFAVIMQDVAEMDEAARLAEAVIAAISNPMMLQGHNVTVGASVGISACPDLAHDTPTLLKTADAAMYAAKGRMKNCYQLYSR